MFDLRDPRRAEHLETAHLGVDVVGFDVNVHAARVVDPLHQNVRLVCRHLQTPILGGIGQIFRRVHGCTQHRAPERGVARDVESLTVDHDCAKAAVVHFDPHDWWR